MFFRTQDLSLVRKGICFGEGKVGGSFGCSDDTENRDVGDCWASWAITHQGFDKRLSLGADCAPHITICPLSFW